MTQPPSVPDWAADVDAYFGPDAAPSPSAVAYTPAPLDDDAECDLAAFAKRLGPALPTDGWLAEYIRAAVPLTAAPPEFHLAAGISVISAVLGNRVFIESWGQRIYPNTWMVIVAQSGFMNKSTSINLARNLVSDAGLDPFYPEETSREAMLAEFAKKPAGLWIHDEFGAFLMTISRDYNAGTKENLTALYGGADVFKRTTKKDGEIVIRRPAISMFGATTIDWLEDRVGGADRRGGFLARILFVTAGIEDKATDRNFTRMPPQDRNRLILGLRAMSTIGVGGQTGTSSAEVMLTPEADQIVRAWFAEWEREITNGTKGQDLQAWAVRLRTYALKLAMIFRASSCAFAPPADATTIDATSMELAIAYCRFVWKNIVRLFDEDFADNKDARAMRMILEKIGRGCSRSHALNRSHMKASDFNQYLDTLVQGGKVVRQERSALELGYLRQRNKTIEWLSQGPDHPERLLLAERQLAAIRESFGTAPSISLDHDAAA
ncbi:MAG TPA: DUF3987 domain-containing protein [Acidimicrobiales bacterium]|nr:DUF3987 domain-containing protein [Acidimicrobiales bacterium]